MRGGAHDVQDFVGVADVRNLNADAVVALTGDGGLGVALIGQTGAHDRDGGVHLRVEILGARVAQIDGVDTAAQIQAQRYRIADRLEDVLADVHAVDGQQADQHDQQQGDAQCDQTLYLHVLKFLPRHGTAWQAMHNKYYTILYYTIGYAIRQYAFA